MICRITSVTRALINSSGVVSGNQTHAQIDEKMERIIKEYEVLCNSGPKSGLVEDQIPSFLMIYTRLSYYNFRTRLVDLVGLCWLKHNLLEKIC